MNLERRRRDASPADITDSHVSVVPSLPAGWAARWAGGRDGRRGIVPDPQTGYTPYLHTVAMVNATMIESERLRTQSHLAPIDRERAVQVERRDRAARELTALGVLGDRDGPSSTAPGGTVGGTAAGIRSDRARTAHIAAAQQRLDSAGERIAQLDELRADRVTVGALRIQRCTERAQQIVGRYWRAFARRHPELPDLRAAYGVPVVDIPSHPLGL